MNKDLKITGNEWADLIDGARDRGAVGDLSVIAYRLLGVVIASQLGHHNKAVESDRAICGLFETCEMATDGCEIKECFKPGGSL